MMQNAALKPFSIGIKKYLLILIGSITWSWTIVKSGWFYSSLGINGGGLGFWGANGHDGIWHIALAESLSRGSFQMPVFADANLQNYHIGFDLILALLHKITFIPIINLYFQIIPIILSFLVGYLTYWFVFEWIKSEKSALWSTFFVYFGGSFGWIIGKGESTFWSQQAISSLINPPFTFSLIFILLGLISLQKNKKLLAVLCFGILIQIKAYAGILVLGALLVSGNFSVFFGSLLVSVLIFLPFNKNPQSLIEWHPFWFLESMMGLADRLGWSRFAEAMVNYRSGNVWFKGTVSYGVALAIFVIGNFGTRIIFIFRKIKLDKINIFIYSIIFAGIIIPLFFVQKGTPWNTIQFFYYSLFFSSILAGISVSRSNRYLLIAIILLTIPTTLITLRDVYIPARPPAMVPSLELSALKFLSTQPDGGVLVQPFSQMNADLAINNPPRPLYLYTSTAYVSAFSKHPTFLEDEINLNITGYDWQTRRVGIVDWFNNSNKEFLIKNNIKYVYLTKDSGFNLNIEKLGVKNIYENNLVILYQVI